MRIPAFVLICSVVFMQTQCAREDTKHSSEFKTWAITSVESGGIDGRHLVFSVDNAGTVLFEDRKHKASAEMTTVNSETLAQMEALLKQLDLPNAGKKWFEKTTECCDQVNSYLVVKLDEREYYPEKLSIGYFQTSNFESLLSFFGQIAEKNKPPLRNQAAELKIKNAKLLSVTVNDAGHKPVWEGKFSRQGESSIFEGEWKRNETTETVKDKVEVVLNGQTVKIIGKGTGNIEVPREFEDILDGYQPGIISKRPAANEISWYARFE